MALYDSRTGVEVIERRDCLSLLASEQLGRLAILDGGDPLILPVNYAFIEESVVFRTGDGSKLDASRGGSACFEIDGVDADTRSGWSVVVRGHLHEIDAHDQPHLDRYSGQVDPWISEPGHLVELQPWSITGRRVLGADPDH